MPGAPWTEEEKARAIDHLIAELEKGEDTANIIMADMPKHGIRRLTKQTLHEWRATDPELGKRLDEAFEIGSDRMAQKGQKVADGVDGYSSKNVKRDRLKLFWIDKMLQVRNTRYRPRQVHSNDPDNPMPAMQATQFIVQPVMPTHPADDPDVPGLEDEDGDGTV